MYFFLCIEDIEALGLDNKATAGGKTRQGSAAIRPRTANMRKWTINIFRNSTFGGVFFLVFGCYLYAQLP